MDNYYIELANAIQARLAVIGDHALGKENPAAHLEQLRLASERIEKLKMALPPDADPMLAHYLQKSSLTKALEFLQSKAENP